jgi:hypothetical protein
VRLVADLLLRQPHPRFELVAHLRVGRVVSDVDELLRVGLEVVELPLLGEAPAGAAGQAQAVVVEEDEGVAVGAVAVA